MPLLLLALAAATPAPLDPLRFFAGRTEGVGHLRIVLRHPRPMRVHGVGQAQPDGSLILDQQVEQDGRPAITRRWHLRRIAPGRYAGTLTDARGPVTAALVGDRLHIAYRTQGKVRIEQWLTPAPDGRSAANRLVALRFGIVVARRAATIRSP